MRRRHVLRTAALLPTAAGAQQATPPTVFAAASLTDALRALAAEWRAGGNPAPRFAFAASSALARQIEQGAPADLFLSADEPWMDYLQQRDLIVPASRTSVLGNRLVLIAPADAGRPGPTGGAAGPNAAADARPMTLARATDLASLLGATGRLATGDPAHVPVGRYAQAALTWLGQWPALSSRLARADNVRAALLLVERGEAPYGIVYATDAAASPAVRVVASFPAESHPPISYPFALTRRATGDAAARDFLAHLTAAAAEPTWVRFGFILRH